MLIMAFYLAGWRHRRYTVKRMSRQRELTSNLYHPESAALLDQTDSKPKTGSFPAKQVQTVASQTEPDETSLQQIRRSLNLENYFPHSSCDVVLRRKGSNAGHLHARPASQPIDRRPTRSRLSATSTINENKRRPDSEFNVLSEQVPSSASLHPDTARYDNSSSDSPQANCDQDSIETNCSLYISESSTGSSSSDGDEVLDKKRACETNGLIRHRPPHKPAALIKSHPAAAGITANNNSKQFTPRQYNGN